MNSPIWVLDATKTVISSPSQGELEEDLHIT